MRSHDMRIVGDKILHALNVLARDRMIDFQELADETFSDLVKKRGRTGGPQSGPARERGERSSSNVRGSRGVKRYLNLSGRN
jgi:hypothetical protein